MTPDQKGDTQWLFIEWMVVEWDRFTILKDLCVRGPHYAWEKTLFSSVLLVQFKFVSGTTDVYFEIEFGIKHIHQSESIRANTANLSLKDIWSFFKCSILLNDVIHKSLDFSSLFICNFFFLPYQRFLERLSAHSLLWKCASEWVVCWMDAWVREWAESPKEVTDGMNLTWVRTRSSINAFTFSMEKQSVHSYLNFTSIHCE